MTLCSSHCVQVTSSLILYYDKRYLDGETGAAYWQVWHATMWRSEPFTLPMATADSPAHAPNPFILFYVHVAS